MEKLNQVTIEASSLTHGRLTGVGVYVTELIKGLAAQDLVSSLAVKASRRKSIRHVQDLVSLHINMKCHWAGMNLKGLLHCPDYYVPRFHRACVVLTVHDLVTFTEGLVDPKFQRKGQIELKNNLHRRVAHIITPTEYIKNQLLTYFPEFEGRVTAIYHGANHINFENDQKWLLQSKQKRDVSVRETLSHQMKKPYFLYIGTVEKRKNTANLIQAFDLFCHSRHDIHLMIAGGRGYAAEETLHAYEKAKHKSRIYMLDYVTDFERMLLMKNSIALMYPSLYEGFGFPIVEAFKAEKPILTSHMGAMSEVAGGAAHLVDPFSVESIKEGMIKIHDDRQYVVDLVDAGKSRAREMSWDCCVQKTVAIYKSLSSHL